MKYASFFLGVDVGTNLCVRAGPSCRMGQIQIRVVQCLDP